MVFYGNSGSVKGFTGSSDKPAEHDDGLTLKSSSAAVT